MKNYSDLHCHPSLYGFNRLRHSPSEADPEIFNPWHVPDDVDHIAMAQGKRGARYTQCTMPMLVKSRTRLVYASITPIEQGFFVGSTEGEETSFGLEVVKWVSGRTLVSSATALLRGERFEAGHHALGVLRNRGPARRALQRFVLRYSPERIRFMQSPEFDYWEEFLREYRYFENADGREQTGILTNPDGTTEEVTGTYHLVRDGAHLGEILDNDDDVAVLLTIEGAHSFSIGPDHERVGRDVLFDRVRTLKSLPHAISFITISHHFDNGLCGHARSLPDIAGWVMDQTRRMREDFEPIGLEVTRELLDLDESLRPMGGRRILIDLKHLAPAARRTYYRQIIEPYNAWAAENGEDPIPVVISHTAYSGAATLDELVRDSDKEDDHWHSPPFLRWGINHCDEDVRAVHASHGLLGLVFDQRVCGVGLRQKLHDERWIDLLMQHVLATVDVVLQDERLSHEERMRMWDCICLGTDYDGMIDPLTTYPTVLHFDALRDDLVDAFDRLKHTRGIAEIGVERIVDKFLWSNGVEFAKRTL